MYEHRSLTVLHPTVSYGCESPWTLAILNFFIARGADTGAKDRYGASVLDAPTQYGKQRIMQSLRRAIRSQHP